MASRRVLEEDLLDAVFDGLSDEDNSDLEGDDEIHAFLGARLVPRADLMAANLGEEGDDDPTDREEHFDRADLMAGSLGVTGRDQEDEEASSLSLRASTMGSSDANPDTSAIENYLSDREVLAAYTVRLKPIDK